ncbi:MAG: RDD family protein [Chloroflexota bacterium]|nr:RDD family protein [Chloroflexota bacterium]
MGFWIRLSAAVIDGILLSIVNFELGLFLGLVDSPLTILVNLVIGWAYQVGFIATKGQTLGKVALGIQVVDSKGDIPGIGAVLLREIVGKFLSAIALGLGYPWGAWDPEKRGWHDHIAGTYVVRKQAER